MTAIVVDAEFELLSPEGGGRSAPVMSGYTPNHRFDPESYYIGIIEYGDDGWHRPGTKRTVRIRFMPSPGLKERLIPGYQWDVTEGGHVIGHAKAVRVLGEMD